MLYRHRATNGWDVWDGWDDWAEADDTDDRLAARPRAPHPPGYNARRALVLRVIPALLPARPRSLSRLNAVLAN